MNFVKPTEEQIEKILQSDKSFRFKVGGSTIYHLSKSNPGVDDIVNIGGEDFYVHWDATTSRIDCNSYSLVQVKEFLERSWLIAEDDLAQLEDTSKRHKHYDLIKQWIEDPDGYDVYCRDNQFCTDVVITMPTWNQKLTYRLEKKKPKVKKYKVLFKIGYEYEVSEDYYKDEADWNEQYPEFKCIQLIQESEKEF